MLIQEEIWDEADIIRYRYDVQRQVSLARVKMKRMKSVDAERGRGPLSPLNPSHVQQSEVSFGVLLFVFHAITLYLLRVPKYKFDKS